MYNDLKSRSDKMAERFTWRGLPVRDAQGNVVAVQPVRNIVAPNGIHYRGVLSHDADGQAFTYNQVPNDWRPEPIEWKRLIDGSGRSIIDGAGFRIMVRG